MVTALLVINHKDFSSSTNTVNVYLLMCESLVVISDQHSLSIAKSA